MMTAHKQNEETMDVVVVRAEQMGDEQRNLFVAQSCETDDPSPARREYLRGMLAQKQLGALFYVRSGSRLLVKAALFWSKVDPNRAYLGCYEVSDGPERQAMVHALLQAVRNLAREKSVKRIYGPVDCNTWYSYRVRTDDDPLTFAWEPARNPLLLQDWQDFGFHVDSYFSSYGSTILRWTFLSALPTFLKAWLRGYQTVPMKKVWAENLPEMHRIIHESFTVNQLFEAMEYPEFVKLYGNLNKKYDVSPSFYLLNPKGERIGFILSYYDGDYIILKSLAITRSAQGERVSKALVYITSWAGIKAGKKCGAAVLIRSGLRTDTMMLYVQKIRLVTWLHRYQLLSLDV